MLLSVCCLLYAAHAIHAWQNSILDMFMLTMLSDAAGGLFWEGPMYM